jgi:urease accessory protein
MRLAEPIAAAGWRAALALDFARRGGRTVLAARRHDGPLVVQKPLYPEGEGVCHAIVVHPPAGIAGGDLLELRARAGEGAQALLTTPGAARWYRSAGALASQDIEIEAAEGACVEWLPQETILYEGTLAVLRAKVRLSGKACYLGWEILCFGRTGSGERFARGACSLDTRIERDGRLLWFERGRITGGGALLASPAGLSGRSVCGTLIAASPALGDDLLAACRAIAPREGEAAVTRLPSLLLARYLGDSSEAAKRYFAALWSALRPALAGRKARAPRIWST